MAAQELDESTSCTNEEGPGQEPCPPRKRETGQERLRAGYVVKAEHEGWQGISNDNWVRCQIAWFLESMSDGFLGQWPEDA